MPCGICGKPIDGTPGAALPHIVRNRREPLFPLSGRSFHGECFSEHPLRELALRRSQERSRRVKNVSPVCVVCGQELTEDWYNTEFLTDDRMSPLYEFNCLHFHRRHLRLWSRFEQFRQLVAEFERSGEYEGPPILPE
jgi:hypothetical protein